MECYTNSSTSICLFYDVVGHPVFDATGHVEIFCFRIDYSFMTFVGVMDFI
jgi:hypothetical protein